MIAIKNLNITKIFLGSTELRNIAIGDELLLSSSLPYDAEIEYLETDGNAYIDTGLTISYNRAIAGKYYAPSADNMIWGSRWNNYRFQYYLRKGGNGNTYLRVNDQIYTFEGSKSIETHEFLFDIGNAYVIFDGARTDFPAPSQLPIDDRSKKEILFKYWNNGIVPDNYDTKRIYWAKYWEAGVLMRDFIPVRKGSTGYMYDRVSGQLFGNEASTGDFILGNDI